MSPNDRGEPRDGEEASADAENDEDAAAFAEAMRGATPLDLDQRRRRAPAASERPARDPARARAPAQGAGTDAFTVEVAGGTVAGRAPGIEARQLRSLRAGDYPIEARLDLHGRARAEAAPALERFVAAAAASGRRCLLVIHGRGNRSAPDGPVVRPAVWDWLSGSRRARASVMAFVSAPPRLGGAGATLILLRKSRAPG